MNALAIILLSAASVAADKPDLLVMDLKAETGVTESAARLLNELILGEYAAVGRYRVTGGSDLAAMITTEQQKQMVGCSQDDSCLVEIAGALDADFLAVTAVGVIGNQYLVNAKIIDVKGARVQARVTRKAEADESELIAAVERAVRDVIAQSADRADSTELPPSAVSVSAAGTNHTVEWVGLGASAAAVAAGVVLLVVRPSTASIEDDQYAAYQGSPTDSTYAAVQDEVSKSNTMAIAGGALVGVGVVGAALCVVGLLSGDDVAVSAAPAPGGAVIGLGGVW